MIVTTRSFLAWSAAFFANSLFGPSINVLKVLFGLMLCLFPALLCFVGSFFIINLKWLIWKQLTYYKLGITFLFYYNCLLNYNEKRTKAPRASLLFISCQILIDEIHNLSMWCTWGGVYVPPNLGIPKLFPVSEWVAHNFPSQLILSVTPPPRCTTWTGYVIRL